MQYRQAGDEFLETAVMSASPEKLRLMMLELALQKTTEAIASAEQCGRVEPNEHTIYLRDTLNELLAGIAPSDNQLPHQVADLYVFLLQWLTTAENKGEIDRLHDIRRVLNIERETWLEVTHQRIGLPDESRSAPTGQPSPCDESISFDA